MWKLIKFHTKSEGGHDTLINSQESVITDDGSNKAPMIPTTSEAEGSKTAAAKDQAKEIQVKRSERLVKDVIFTTQEKNEAMARKRNLEGINVKTHIIVDMDNDVLGKLAKICVCLFMIMLMLLLTCLKILSLLGIV